MDHIEAVRLTEHHPELLHVLGDRLSRDGVASEGAWRWGHQPGIRARVPARKERDVMTASHELLSHIRDDALGAPVTIGGNGLGERRDLSDPH
jgi:hypothetical protein